MDYGDGEWRKWDSFWGAPFIWTALHDFGGTDALKGNMTYAASWPGAFHGLPLSLRCPCLPWPQ